MTTMTVVAPRAVASPRGAAYAAWVFTSLLAWFSRQAQARRDRLDAAGRVADAAKVRALAWQVMDQDRRYAADLLAAADRHERV